MLVLSRKEEETIVIDVPDTRDKIRIVLLKSDKGRAVLGVDAPPNYLVVRKELLDRGPRILDEF